MSASLAATSLSPIRRRRFLYFVIFLVGLLFFFGVPWELPPSLRDASLSALSRASISHYAKGKNDLALVPKVNEIFGLLYMVTEDTDRALTSVEDLDPSQPINMTTYAGSKERDWVQTEQMLNKKYPIVVFSKSYCPYSRRAWKLLDTYKIRPPPVLIEVDLRPDMDAIKSILSRLTKHDTFPNIIIRGQSIGGSDDLQALHAQRLLSQTLEKAGAAVRNDGSGK